MKLRDQNKDEIYFNDFINKRSNILSKSEFKIRNKLIKSDRVYSVINNNFKKYLSLIKAKYSRGDDMLTESIYNDFGKSLKALHKSWKKKRRLISIRENDKTLFLNQYGEESYIDILELISIAVLIIPL
jgi:galactokinase/mevalonate kinase-like predicted kinase